MKTLYLDLSMGAAGDMLAAALIDLLPAQENLLYYLNSLFEGRVRFVLEDCEKLDAAGKRFRVFIDGHEEGGDEHEHEHHHEHSTLSSIYDIIDALPLDNAFPRAKKNAKEIYRLLADAESEAHGVPVDAVHFHEVGALDAVADITAVCLALDWLEPDRIIASSVNVGSGEVHCAHGVLPVPAPATQNLIRGSIPYYSSGIKGELLTPTGAALLKFFVNEYGPSPVIVPERISYGMGKRDYSKVNAVRAILGESAEMSPRISELEFNVDDMTGEELGFLTEELFDNEALDVFTVPVYMKKNRPGVLVTVLCDEAREGELVGVIFRHSSTLGVRIARKERYTLERQTCRYDIDRSTMGGVKQAKGFGVKKFKAEYEPSAELAREKGLPLREVMRETEEFWKNTDTWKEY